MKLCLPENASHERKQIMKNYGAEMVFSDPGEGSDGAIRLCQEDLRGRSGRLFLSGPVQQPGQLESAFRRHRRSRSWSRPRARSRTLWPAWAPAERSWGTRGGSSAICPHVQCISAQPSSGFHGLEGLKHMPTNIVPGIYDPTLADDNLWIETEDAYAMTRWLGRNEGLLAGMSSGANVHAAREVAKRLAKEGRGGVIVTIMRRRRDQVLERAILE